MDIIGAVGHTSAILTERAGTPQEAASKLSSQAASEVIDWVSHTHHGTAKPAEAAKKLFNAAWCFLNAASALGLNLHESFREILLQTEEFTDHTAEFLDDYERDEAIYAREKARQVAKKTAVEDILRAYVASRKAA